MNAQKYVAVLQDHLLPQLREWFEDGDVIFMQDGAPCHTAKVTIAYLQHEGVKVLKWPGNSPDLNPIETLGHCEAPPADPNHQDKE